MTHSLAPPHPTETTNGHDRDIQLNDIDGSTWRYKRNPHITRVLSDCFWCHNGISHLRPEIQLLHKAKHVRDNDTVDFQRCLPLLDEPSRAWLAQSLRLENPQHRWLTEIAAHL